MNTLHDFVDKYMRILGTEGPPPKVVVRSNLGSRWIGGTEWSTKNPTTTTIYIQQSILNDPRTVERVIAHEVVHHDNFVSMTPEMIARIRHSRSFAPDGHGRPFLYGAAVINRVMGADFVTVTSDQGYVVAKNTKAFFVLIEPVHGGVLGYAWAARLSPDGTERARHAVAHGAKLVKTTDELWTRGVAKIKKYGGLNVPRSGGEQEAALRRLFADGEPVLV